MANRPQVALLIESSRGYGRGLLRGIADYVRDLEAVGFIDIVATDMTDDWTPFVTQRLTAWRENHAAYARAHGEAAYVAQETFFAAVARLFESGSLGGVRLVARVPT